MCLGMVYPNLAYCCFMTHDQAIMLSYREHSTQCANQILKSKKNKLHAGPLTSYRPLALPMSLVQHRVLTTSKGNKFEHPWENVARNDRLMPASPFRFQCITPPPLTVLTGFGWMEDFRQCHPWVRSIVPPFFLNRKAYRNFPLLGSLP